METEKSDSMVQKALESLCRNNGWSYGVFWRFGRRNSSLLTLDAAYYKQHMGFIIDNMLLQVYMIGNGIVGQSAFTKKHRWMFSDADSGAQNPAGFVRNQDMFEDYSEIHRQFSCGIETVALIYVEPEGVVQFGSTQKIPESVEFVDQTKRVFREMENGDMEFLPDTMTSSSNLEIYGQSRFFASLISSGNSSPGNLKPMHGGSSENYVRRTCSLTDLPRLSPFTSYHGTTDSSHLQNQLQIVGTEAPFKLITKSNSWLQDPLVKSTTCVNSSDALSPCISISSSGHSTLTSFELQLPSETMLAAKTNTVTCCSNEVLNFHDSTFTSGFGAGGLVEVEKRSTSPSTFQKLFNAGDFMTAVSKSFPSGNSCPWIVPSQEQHFNTLATSQSGNLSRAMEVSSPSSGLDGIEVLINTPLNNPAHSVPSSIMNSFNFVGNKDFLNEPSVGKDVFDSLGVDFEWGQADEFLNDILMPAASGCLLDFSTDTLECISEQPVGSMVGPQQRLFSKSGLEQFVDGIAGSPNSCAISGFEDELSSASKRRMGSSSVSGDQVQLTSLPVLNLGRSYNLKRKKEVISKSEVDSSIGDSDSITFTRSVASQPKKSKQSVKVGSKGSRKTSKNVAQMRERIAELRKLFPNTSKMDQCSLLAQTIEHLLFLQGVTKQTEKLKQAEELRGSGMAPRDSSSSSAFMWECEVEARIVMDPVDVKDISCTGQKLIQMLFEGGGFFLEIVDVIQDCGLTILKGVMEIREKKIWACFIVEAEANRHVTKQEIYVSLHRLLFSKATSEINVVDQLANVVNRGTSLFNRYHQPLGSSL